METAVTPGRFTKHIEALAAAAALAGVCAADG
jgi:hypothetical protein